MTNYDAPLVAAVVFSLAAFIAPVYAQQETVAEFQALEWFTGRPDVLALKIEKSRSEETAATDTLPAHCRVRGVVNRAIRFEVTMPVAEWNGRQMFSTVGGGARLSAS